MFGNYNGIGAALGITISTHSRRPMKR